MKQLEEQRRIPLGKRLLARILYLAIRALCGTIRLQVERERETEQLVAERGGLLVSWHGQTLVPINRFRGRKNYHGLISMSKDGDLLSEIFRCYGMGMVRGSTGRRGVLATREVLTLLQRGEVVICTPDGPRGPVAQAQPGALYFAQRTGLPLVAVGVAASPGWQMRSWDHFLVPKPFSRVHWVYGDPFYVGRDEPIEKAQQRLTEEINRVQNGAEHAVRA